MDKKDVLITLAVIFTIVVTMVFSIRALFKEQDWETILRDSQQDLTLIAKDDSTYVYGVTPAIHQCRTVLPKVTKARLDMPILSTRLDELSTRYVKSKNIHMIFFRLDIKGRDGYPFEVEAVCLISAATSEMIELQFDRVWF